MNLVPVDFSRLSCVTLPPSGDELAYGLDKLALSLTELQAAVTEVDPEPSEAQKESGNYKKGHVAWKGLQLTIESAKGQYRRGVTKEGKPWQTLMKDHYGYIKNTKSEADGDHVDIFLCDDDLDSEVVFIINQYVGGKFDEHKCVLGTTSEEKAKEVYHRNYQKGWDGFHSIAPITLPQFKWWLAFGDTSKEIEDGMFAKHKKKASFLDGHGDRYEYKPCPQCSGSMTNKNEAGDTMRGSIRCLGCGHARSSRDWAVKLAYDEEDRCDGCGLRYAGREQYGPFCGNCVRFGAPPAERVAEVLGMEHLVEKRAKLLPGISLRPHQQEIAATGEDDDTRMLLYHSLGSGKSLSGLSAAETAGEPYTAVTPASLRPNMRKEQEKFTDMTTPNQLVSYNSVAKGQVPPTPTLVMDEAQRLRNPDSLTTQNATELADQAKRVYLLSGTPIVNHPRELAPMIRILTGQQFDPEEFDRRFIDERKISPGLLGWLRGVKPVRVPQMKNKDEFEDLMRGHVHYYAPDKPDVEKQEEHIVTDMSPEQAKLYRGFWDQLPWLYRWKLQHSFPLSRQELVRLSSFLSGPRQVGLSTFPFMRGKADALTAYQQSPKLQRAMTEMRQLLDQDPEARGVAFSNFIDAGLTPYAAALQQAGIPHGVFHGGLNDATRKKVVEDYNNGRIRALLLGPSGGEGLSLKGTRMLQILDPHWNSARSEQAIGRGIRYDSHNYLPLEDRNVRVQRYVSQLPRTRMQRIWRSIVGNRRDEDPRRASPGVDTYLEDLAKRKDTLNDQFLAELQRIGSMKQGADEACAELARKMAEAERQFTVAVDLDGTLAEEGEFDPDMIGAPRPGAVEWMKKFQEAGARLIIHTVRDADDLVAEWCEENDIPFDYINENPDQPDGSSDKLFADVYLDNRAVDASGDWDGHGEAVLRRVKSAFTVRLDQADALDALVAGLVDARSTHHTAA